MLEDPLGLDRRLRETARSLNAFRAELRQGRGEDHAFDFLGRRASVEFISELADATHDPLAPALLGWALRLHEEHALIDLDVAHAAAVRVTRHPIDAPERGEYTLRDFLEHALANTKNQRPAWLRLLVERAERATDLAVRRAELRAEVRADLARFVPADFFGGEGAPARAVAERWLGETHEAFATLGIETLADVFEAGVGRDSRATWPARVTPRSLAELFRETRWLTGVAPETNVAVTPFGAASFLRALYRFGAALRGALTDPKRPFVLAHDPLGFERATFGALFALLPANRAFAKRALGVSAHALADHRRTLARVLLIATREAALKTLLHAASFDGRKRLAETYAEWTHRALGVELDPSAFGILFTPRPSDGTRLRTLFVATELDARLIHDHDEDWYRNPRAVDELRETARVPAPSGAGADVIERGGQRLAAALRDVL